MMSILEYDNIMSILANLFSKNIFNDYNFLRWNLNNFGYGLFFSPIIYLTINGILGSIIKNFKIKNILAWIITIPTITLAGLITELVNSPGSDASIFSYDFNDVRAFIFGAGVLPIANIIFHLISKVGLMSSIKNLFIGAKKTISNSRIYIFLERYSSGIVIICLFVGLVTWLFLQILK